MAEKKAYTFVPGTAALGLLGASLPMKWVTLHEVPHYVGQPFGSFDHLLPRTTAVPLTGLDGAIRLGAGVPFWFIAALAGASVLIAVLNRMRLVILPAWAACLPALLAGIFMAGAFYAWTHTQAVVGTGFGAAVLGTCCALVSAAASRPPEKQDS